MMGSARGDWRVVRPICNRASCSHNKVFYFGVFDSQKVENL